MDRAEALESMGRLEACWQVQLDQESGHLESLEPISSFSGG